MARGQTLYYYWSKFQPARLTAGRELRGLTKKALAGRINKTAGAITQFEANTSGLDIQTFESIVNALNLPPAFFALQDGTGIELGSCHFRANIDVSQLVRKEAKGYAERVMDIFNVLDKMGVQFPEVSIVTTEISSLLSAKEIDSTASETRKSWGLGLGPIDNMAQLLESKGIFIVLLPDKYKGIDAFSVWAGDERPCIGAVASSNASRLQFDFGHELAHLLFHRYVPTGLKETERVANAFSGAFLMPSGTFGRYCPAIWNERAFLDVKKEWFVSMQAAMYRARELGRLSESSHRRGMIYLRGKGLHINEPGEFARPYPSMLAEALNLVVGEISLTELAEEIGLGIEEFEQMLQTQQVPQELINKFKPNKPKAKILKFVPPSS